MTLPTTEPLLTTGTVADCLGVSRKQVRAWVHRGLLAPRSRTAHGYYLWAESDVAAVARVRDMADARDEYLSRLSEVRHV